jgi:hypothetical protein
MYDEWLENNVDIPSVDSELERVIQQYAVNLAKEPKNENS